MDDRPTFHPGVGAPEIEYMLERRRQLGGSLPHREVRAKALKLPGDAVYSELRKGNAKHTPAPRSTARLDIGILRLAPFMGGSAAADETRS